jgi:two-component system, chemotaxis family, response regulator Rcp1
MEVKSKNVHILLVESSKADVSLIQNAFGNGTLTGDFCVLGDGEAAINYLTSLGKEENGYVRPDMILLDLNLPGGNGLKVLEEIKANSALRTIPVVVLTASSTEENIYKSYDLNANCCIVKPTDSERLADIIKLIGSFWFGIAKLPSAN